MSRSCNILRAAAPWEHEVLEKDDFNAGDSDTVRDFNYRRQRRRLVVNSAFQWAVTASICVALAAVLYWYSNLQTLSQNQKHTFNALVTGLSVSLGLSLASSLRGFALMMRWRLLATKYRSLQAFDLILSCDDQTKVVRLLWVARTQGRWWIPNRTQTLCFIWLFINVALQVFTALLGLTYSVDTSSTVAYPVWCNVSIADLGNINTIDYDSPDFSDQAGAANAFGMEGDGFWNLSNVPAEDQINQETYYSNSDYTTFWYGVRDPPEGGMAYSGLAGAVVKHVDVIEEVEGLGRADARMLNGLYDGTNTWNPEDNRQEPLMRKRGTRRPSIGITTVMIPYFQSAFLGLHTSIAVE